MFNPIERHYVHKVRQENVLLSNLRRILPSAIEAHTFEALVQKLNGEDADALSFAYIKANGPNAFSYADHYLMREISGVLNLPAVVYETVYKSLAEDEAAVFADSYSQWESEGIYVLQKPLHDELLRRVVRLGNLQTHYLPNDLQARISDLFEQHDIGPKTDVYFTNMLVDTKHEFFFEHENEHVPGMMILEAARQLAVALPHKFGNVPFSGSNLILDQLDARFDGYVELYAPILIRASFKEKREHHGVWSYLVIEMDIYQNGQPAGTVHCSGSVISAGLFERIRRIKRDELKKLPFVPSENLNYNLLLKGARDTVWHEAKIRELNLGSFSIDQTLPVDALSAPYFDFVFVVPGLGLTKGTCTPVQGFQGAGNQMRLAISGMSKSEETRFELILKRYCKVPEEVAM